MDSEADIIVIGAGVAGLAVAADLTSHGARVLVLEARGRLGGRILTERPPAWKIPVELGAEFIHGGNEALWSVLRGAGLEASPAEGGMWRLEGGKLRAFPDFWEHMARVMKRIDAPGGDQAFEDFLQKQCIGLTENERQRAREFVESFNAAPSNRISAAVLEAEKGGAEAEQFRLRQGYDSLISALRARLPANRGEVRLNTVVRAVEWRPGAVAVRVESPATGASSLHRARATVITLPLGVLKKRAVTFAPALTQKDAVIDRLGWGDVGRVILRFDDDFWADEIVPAQLRADGARAFGFVTSPGEPIPVWWAPGAPAPVLVGWVGGPPAKRLAGLSIEDVITDAARSLATIFGASPAEVRRRIRDGLWHDWRGDAFCGGAYSFPVAGQEDGPKRLAEPVEATLFFAGEATAAPGDLGTVHGALASGRRAAEEVLAALAAERHGWLAPIDPTR